jgi:hypothetical protein
MGLDNSSVMFLCAAKSMGVDFDSTAMIGRQSFWPDVPTLRSVLRVLGIERSAAELQAHPYAEEFFSLLGATRIDSVDASHYENATILHDMNFPLPGHLRERFSVVHDGGTLEHVFNIPQAFKNCMEMVRVGGHFIQVGVTNNFVGHGFWQVSPELIFRIFTADNGFRLEAVLMHEVTVGSAWYVVSDPDDIRRRIELCNDVPTYILTIAKRIDRVPIFVKPPQQSDYVRVWDVAPKRIHPDRTSGLTLGARWKRHVPPSAKRLFRLVVPGVTRGFGRPGYRRIREEDLLRGRLANGDRPRESDGRHR